LSQISCIVEGHGEVAALPILLRRFAAWEGRDLDIDVPQPIRVKRDRFLRSEDDFRKYLFLADSKCSADGLVLLLLDADDDCPAELGPDLLARARGVLPKRMISVVLANREFEAWYIGAAKSLDGFRGFGIKPGDSPDRAELPRDAKGWLASRILRGSYGETTDQPAFAARMDLSQAFDNCRSFRKLCRDLDAKFGAR
jgi:Domain of unknown function (DUF4276)